MLDFVSSVLLPAVEVVGLVEPDFTLAMTYSFFLLGTSLVDDDDLEVVEIAGGFDFFLT